MSQILFSQVSQPRQALIRLCQTINHGSIEDLQVEHSEPVFDPWPLILKDCLKTIRRGMPSRTSTRRSVPPFISCRAVIGGRAPSTTAFAISSGSGIATDIYRYRAASNGRRDVAQRVICAHIEKRIASRSLWVVMCSR
jgi:hypothetical protein